MPYCESSHAVNRAPCSNGRVSSANTSLKTPRSNNSRITPSAVPQSVVAKVPVLQWVNALIGLLETFCSIQSAASFAIARLACESAIAISSAFFNTAAKPCGNKSSTCSTPQARLTAVGRASRIRIIS